MAAGGGEGGAVRRRGPFEGSPQGLTDTASDVVGTLIEALGFDREHQEARRLLADYYWERFSDAEGRRDEDATDFFGKLVARYHDGRYERELRADGSLALASDPAGAEAWLYRYVERGPVLVETNPRRLGTTPLAPLELAMGSYLVVLKKDGYRDVRYPVFISRNRDWTGTVNLYAEDEIGAGFVYVPAGPFIQGGDPGSGAWSLPWSEPHIADFFIGLHPVTMAEYVEFLNDVATHDRERALKRSPRLKPEGGSYLVAAPDGRLELPVVDAEGDRWYPTLPAMAISWYDAVAYSEWRSAKEGRELRLPTESEWEKTARGVDGRWYPWGNRFDRSLCNIRESRRARPVGVPVEEFPTDVSVYGVRGLGGNVRDWTSTRWIQGEGPEARVSRVVRGGAWGDASVSSRGACRFWLDAALVSGSRGFRLARSARGAR